MNQPRGQARKRAIIVGGGLAGLSAAEALARECAGLFEIALLESKRVTGGRAASFSDPCSGASVDYCQHVAMGCCTNLRGLLKRCGIAESMQRYRELQFLHPDCPPSRFAPSRILPAPMHFALALGSLRYLNREQRRRVRLGLLRLFRVASASLGDQTAGDWLRDNDQDAMTIRLFWDVIVVSALGEQTEIVAISAVRKVLVDGFAAARGASDLLLPRLPLAELFGKRLCGEVETLGVKVCTGTPVTRVDKGDQSPATVETSDGFRHQADHVIVAVPWHAIGNLLSESILPGVQAYSRFPASPITGLHLWFDREITDRPHAVMVGTVAQWLFRDPLQDRSSESTGYYQVVISASHEARSHPKEQLVATVLGELRQALPAARKAVLIRSRIVTDPNAVFSIRPEVEAIRPPAKTPLPWLHLAGDWIATGWPSTMEGAVISGRMAACSVAQHEGLAPIVVDPGLPRGWLARRMIRT